MPWHFGGEERLTDDEVFAYFKHYQEKAKRENAQAKQAANRSRSAPRKSPRRR